MVDMKALLAEAQDDVTDLTQDNGGFERELPAEGNSIARLISYVEFGKWPENSKFGEKPPSLKAKLTFELTSKKYAKEVEIEKDGEKSKKTFYPLISITVRIKQSQKSNTFKLLKKMAGGRDEIKHFMQMLGESFIVTVKHNKSADGKQTFANLEEIKPPLVSVPVGDPTDGNFEDRRVQAAVTDSPVRLLRWDRPTVQQWESLYIEKSNFLQVECTKAVDFEESALFALLLENKLPIPTDEKSQEPAGDPLAGVASEATPAQPEEPKASPEPAPKAEATKAAPKAETKAAPATDPLAALGL